MTSDGEDDGIDCEVRKSADESCSMLLHTISPRVRDGLTIADTKEIDAFIDSEDFRLLSASGPKEKRDNRKRTFVEKDSFALY